MPFVSNMNDEEENKQANGAIGAVSPQSGGSVHLAPDSAVGDSAGTGVVGGGAKPGGSFATLDKYITANQGQAAPLAGKIVGGINQEYNTLDQGNQSTNTAIRNQVENAPGYTKGNSDLVSQFNADPTSFAKNNNNVQSFQKQLTNSYGGPNSAESTKEFQDQQAKLNNAISTGKTQTTTEAGRNQLIAKNSAAPTAGVTALNSAILSEDPQYLGQVEGAYKPFDNLVSGLNSSGQAINNTIGSEKADAESSRAASNKAISDQISGLNSDVQNKVQTLQQTGTQQNAALKKALTEGSVSDDQLADLGFDRNQWNSLSTAQKAAATSEVVNSADNKFAANTGTANIDLNSWLTQLDPNAVYNKDNVATADQYNKAGAFQSLLSGLNLNTPQSIIDPTNAAKAGTAPTDLNTYDYTSALDTTQQTAKAERAAAQAYVNAIQSGQDEEHAQRQAENAAKNEDIAGGIGTAAGAAIGSIWGQPVLGGAIGNYAGRSGYNTTKTYVDEIKHPSLNTAADVITGGGVTIAKDAVKTLKNMFCFHPYTQVEMASGETKAICDIQVGEWTKGGMVFATTRGVGVQFYWYKNVLVTGKHAVKEDGRWLRIEDSLLAKAVPQMTEVVCNLVTETHRIYTNGVEFADEHETDDYEMLDLNESLAAMNRNE